MIMPPSPPKKPNEPQRTRSLHPATVAQPKRLSGGAPSRPPHPATVVQPKRPFGGARSTPPHPATVAQPKAPHTLPDAVVPSPHPATVTLRDWTAASCVPGVGARGRRDAGTPSTVQASSSNLDDTSLFVENYKGNIRQGRTTTYYRRTGLAELKKAVKIGGSAKYDFQEYFKYNSGNYHRLWVSTSLVKVRGFSNVDVSSSSDVVVLFEFIQDILPSFTIKAHQEQGVQHDVNVVALHREGFGDPGNLSSDIGVSRVLDAYKGYNLGFTSKQAKSLNYLLDYIKILSPDGSGWIEDSGEMQRLLS
ncbi:MULTISPECIES: hypothetical protein [Sorangium]|uniref:hypothetical protein n=1 Tax=Sorangium TaxID=39643 RepID=UPI003D9C458D